VAGKSDRSPSLAASMVKEEAGWVEDIPMSDRPLLTPDDARRAIYLDFEGRSGRSPVLLGALWVSRPGHEPLFRHYVLDGVFAPAAEASGASRTTLSGELKSLLKRATDQHRVLVGWSEHEVRTVYEHAPEFAESFDHLYRDARALARRWRRKVHPEFAVPKDDTGKRHTLARYMELADYELPSRFSGGHVGKTIAQVGHSIKRTGSFDSLSEKQRARWEDLLGHNEHDCRATRDICSLALSELADGKHHKHRAKNGENSGGRVA
jgi:hypothetical protein